MDKLIDLGYTAFKFVNGETYRPTPPIFEHQPGWRFLRKVGRLAPFVRNAISALPQRLRPKSEYDRPGKYSPLGYPFGLHSSGPFGEQAAGTWLKPVAALHRFELLRSDYRKAAKEDQFWWDVHARHSSAAAIVSGAPVFDRGAATFAHDIDVEMKNGVYRRGNYFAHFANRSVQPGSVILDYGCGPGRISLMLARSGFKVLGVDPSEAMIALAKGQPDVLGLRAQFEVSGEEALQPDAFDAIVCSSVIEYTPDPDRLLQLFHRSLREAGTLIISYSNRRSPHRLYSKLAGHQNPFTTPYHQSWTWGEFRRLLIRNGFSRTQRPKFFECHWRIDPFLSSLPIGMLGIVVARKSPNSLED